MGGALNYNVPEMLDMVTPLPAQYFIHLHSITTYNRQEANEKGMGT